MCARRILLFLVALLLVGSVASPMCLAFNEKTPVKGADGSREVSKFYGESKLKVSPVETVTGYYTVNGKTVYQTAKWSIEVQDLTDSFEYTWILSSKPSTNVFSLNLEFVNCTYYYQPPLSEEKYPDGYKVTATEARDQKGVLVDSRPENVVGSYAVYSTKRNGVYETGKVAHIYRPLVTDAKGNTIWGVLSIKENTLTVTVDQRWLDKAAYPVRVDPVIGYSTSGGSVAAFNANTVHGYEVSSSSMGAQSWITSYNVLGDSAGGSDAKICLWSNSNGGAFLQSSGVVTMPVGTKPWTRKYVSPVSMSNPPATYLLGIIGNGDLQINYDSGAGVSHIDTSNSYSSPQAFDWTSTGTRQYSIYFTVFQPATITDLTETNHIYAQYQYYTLTFTSVDPLGATDIRGVRIRLLDGTTPKYGFKATGLTGATPTYSVVTGSTVCSLDTANCNWSESGNDGTVTFKIKLDWDATGYDDMEIDVAYNCTTATDVAATVVQTNYATTVCRLVTYNHSANVSSITITTPINVSGVVRYATTATGNTASESYPPDAEFTSIEIRDDQGVTLGTDATIVNGAYSVVGDSSSTIRSTYYYAWINMSDADYVDGYAPDGDYAVVTTIPQFFLLKTIEEGFAFFGLANAVLGQTVPTITAFSAWFTQSVVNIVGLIASIMKFVMSLVASIIFWFTTLVDFSVSVITIVGNIANGTSEWSSAFGNIWSFFGFGNWYRVIPVFAFIFWIDSLPTRCARSGRSLISVVIGDYQVVAYIVGEAWNWSFTVFNFVVNMVMMFVNALTG